MASGWGMYVHDWCGVPQLTHWLCTGTPLYTSDQFFYWSSHWCSLLLFLLVSRNQEYRIIVRFSKWRARESFVYVSLCGVKVVQSFCPSGGTFNMLIEIWQNRFKFPCIKATRSAAYGWAFSCLLMAEYRSFNAILVPASDCGGM
jgi:hypothetical protein